MFIPGYLQSLRPWVVASEPPRRVRGSLFTLEQNQDQPGNRQREQADGVSFRHDSQRPPSSNPIAACCRWFYAPLA